MELGEKFRIIRKQRKLTIRELAKVAGSIASISDFENGHSFLNSDTLSKLLCYLKVEYNEFFDRRTFVDIDYDRFSKEFNEAYSIRDKKKLQNLRDEFYKHGVENYMYRILALSTECLLDQLQEKETSKEIKEELTDYFFSIEIWTNIDINLFGMVKHIFNKASFDLIYEEIKRSMNSNPVNNIDRSKIDCLSQCVRLLILNGDSRESNALLSFMESLLLPNYFCLQLFYLRELRAQYNFVFGNKEVAVNQHREIINSLRIIDLEAVCLEWNQEFQSLEYL